MKITAIVGLAAILLAAGAGVADITIDTVPVGNPDNAADTRYETPGYGAVVYDYNIGKYEVTAGQYTAFLTAAAGVDAHGLYNTDMWSDTDYGCKIERHAGSGTSEDPYQYRVAGEYANRPVNYVSWGDAARFANWLTNGQPTAAQGPGTTETGSYALNGAITDAALLAVERIAEGDRAAGKDYYFITSEDEWYKAAYYNPATSSYFTYPTSSNSAPGCDMEDPSGNNANYCGTAFPIDSPYYTTIVGEFQNSDSPYGTFDQGGNVWEWNESIYYGSDRGLRGGSFYDWIGDGTLHAAGRQIGDPTDEGPVVGFRVSSVPEPATLSLLAMGGLAFIRRRRTKT